MLISHSSFLCYLHVVHCMSGLSQSLSVINILFWTVSAMRIRNDLQENPILNFVRRASSINNIRLYILWHDVRKSKLWSQTRRPLLGNGSVNTSPRRRNNVTMPLLWQQILRKQFVAERRKHVYVETVRRMNCVSCGSTPTLYNEDYRPVTKYYKFYTLLRPKMLHRWPPTIMRDIVSLTNFWCTTNLYLIHDTHSPF
jgi:hypothetical protein